MFYIASCHIIAVADYYNYLMSSSSTILPNDKKSLIGNFELETRIRVIIQEVLAATVRKLSLFAEKMEKFEEYFITFRERFETGERERTHLQAELLRTSEMQTSIRRDMNFQEIKFNEEKERWAIQNKEGRDQFGQLERSVKSLLRQNENINSELSKTKAKFLEYSNTITTLKEEVSWKITKYLQETAESHTQMKVFAEQIKIENFNMGLQIEKQKQKYDHIIVKYEEDLVFRQQTLARMGETNRQNTLRMQDISKLNKAISDMEMTLFERVKASEVKFEDKVKELDKNNQKMAGVFKKIDNFNDILEGIRQQVDHHQANTLSQLDHFLKRANDHSTEQTARMAKDIAALDKKVDRTATTIDQKVEKLEDYIGQKIEFMKMEIETDISSKTVQMLEQKNKSEKSLNTSSLEEINSRISKAQLEQNKLISKIQNAFKEQILDLSKSQSTLKDRLQTKIQEALENARATPTAVQEVYIPARSEGSPGVAAEKVRLIDNQINSLREEMKQVRELLAGLGTVREQVTREGTQVRKCVDDKLVDIEQKVNGKVEKVMFLVTKIRGDSIIRNEFNDKEIKQLRKNLIDLRNRMDTTWKLIPGMGECINLVMSLIFDAEYQHSRIIQDNLPLLSKDAERFNTCCEGVIYQFREKKKPGIICYRHSENKKADLVKATFHAYIQLWEEAYELDFQNKQHLLPKAFYKKLVEKYLKGGKPGTEKDLSSSSQQLQQFNSLQQVRTSGSIAEMSRSQPMEGAMNSSFHIRKKRPSVLKQREKKEEYQALNEEIRQ